MYHCDCTDTKEPRQDDFLNTLDPSDSKYSGTSQDHYEPAEEMELVHNLSMSHWLLVNILMAIPVVGFIILAVWSVSKPKPGKEALVTFARGTIVWRVIRFVIHFFEMLFVLWILNAVFYGCSSL